MANATNSLLNIWGPALLVCFTVLIGIFFQNARQTDLRDSLNRRMDDLNRRMDDVRESLSHRIDSLDSSISQRIDSLQRFMEVEFN